jgi:hypothetical protein
MTDWIHTSEQLPPEGQPVTVMNGPNEQTLIFDQGLWWLPDRSMYVYFTPKVWRHGQVGQSGNPLTVHPPSWGNVINLFACLLFEVEMPPHLAQRCREAKDWMAVHDNDRLFDPQIPAAQIRAAIDLLSPDEMTPHATRLLQGICNQHDPPDAEECQ